MQKSHALILAALALTTPQAWAYNGTETIGDGAYSSAIGGETLNAIDRPIAGFVGDAGEGGAPLTDTSNPNYVNPIFSGWATAVFEYTPSDETTFYGQNGIGPWFADPGLALGPVTGDNFHIVSMGDRHASEIAASVPPGSLTVTFSQAITNGDGADFAVFENGFISDFDTGGGSVSGEVFGELTFVEVSSNGTNFLRLPSIYTGSTEPVGAYGTFDATEVYNLVGKHVNAYGQSWGTPFDLQVLANEQLVLDGVVDLNNIQYVRLIDISGDGSMTDSLGNPIYDSWVTWGSGGADIEAFGVIRHFGESQTATAGDGAIGWGWNTSNGAVRIAYKGLTADTAFNLTTYDGPALDLLGESGPLHGVAFELLNAWELDLGDANFDTDGGFILFGYFDTAFVGDITDLHLLHWTGLNWEQVGIAEIDMDNYLLQSVLLHDASPFAIVRASVPEPTTLVLLGVGVLTMWRRKNR